LPAGWNDLLLGWAGYFGAVRIARFSQFFLADDRSLHREDQYRLAEWLQVFCGLQSANLNANHVVSVQAIFLKSGHFRLFEGAVDFIFHAM
jgi:hypothetical protein